MRILIINLDKSIFKPRSKSLEDLKDYSAFFDKLFIITWTLKNEEPIFFQDKLFIYPTNSSNRISYFFDTWKIFKKILKEENIQIISSQDPFETGFMAWILSRAYKTIFHLQIHTDFLSPYFKKESLVNGFRVFLAKFLIPRSDYVRVVSKKIKQSLVSALSLPVSKITVLPIFVDTKKIKEKPIINSLKKKYNQFSFIILVASRFSVEKNIELVIEVMKDIVKKYPDVGLVIVGDGTRGYKYKTLIKAYGLEKNIIIENWVDDLGSYYKTADLFLLASNYEGYGLTLLEAVSAGCDVVSSNVGVASEILDVDNTFEPGDEVGLKEKVLKAIVGEIKKPKPTNLQTRSEYLELYKQSWQKALNQ